MTDRLISRAQRNDVFALIQRVALDPADFEWGNETDQWYRWEVLRHQPTGSLFKFTDAQRGDGYWLNWWPHDGNGSHLAQSWREASEMVFRWLRRVKADHDAPDLWGELSKQKAIPTADRPEYQAQFTAQELRQLESALDDVERFVKTTQPLEPAQAQQVQRKFTYLKEAARAGARKIDWLNIFVGQMVSMVTERLLDPRFYGPLMSHAGTALNAVFQFGVKLLTS
jgi:hypothetical protein